MRKRKSLLSIQVEPDWTDRAIVVIHRLGNVGRISPSLKRKSVKCTFNTVHAICIVISYLISELSEARRWAVNRSSHTRLIAFRAVCCCLGINEEKPWFAAAE